jgi:hypothetical protein
LLRHNNYEYLITDIKECLNDKLKKKKRKNQSDGDERQINLEERESMSINSNSDNGNEGEEYIMGDSTKSIRKNERMAKNNKKNKNEQNSQKSKDDDSSGQIKLFQMNDNTGNDSESNKNENKKEDSTKKNIDEGNNKDGDFLSTINKLKDEGKLDITDKEVNILSKELDNKSDRLLSIWEIYQNENEEDDFIESIKLFLKIVNKNNNNNNDNNDNQNNKDDNNNNNENNDNDKPYVKEIISGIKGVKYGKKVTRK